MTFVRSLFQFGFALAACAMPTAILAAPAVPAANATAGARLIHPMSVVKLADLQFGGVSVTAAGTVVIDPNTNAVTTTGGALLAGGTAHPALFMGSAGKPTVVNIRIPKQPVTLRREGGTETVTVSNWTLQGQDKRTIARQSSFTFAVGGTLAVAANQAEGTYSGTFNIEVQYP